MHGSAARDPLIGRVLHERYRVEKRIGKGGMGIVYLAEHVLLQRKVALKTLSDRAFASDEAIARFHREAVAAAAVGNEHVVGVTDMGQLEDGTYYVALEYLDGADLGHTVATDGPFSQARAVALVLQLCDALTAVHDAGIVHRDLKPENLFLIERAGVADFLKVLDFGVCKLLGDAKDGDRRLTHSHQSLGTPHFMAPEQIERVAAVDARTDIYAAGAILYYALTGAPPFDEESLPRLFMRICSEPPPKLTDKRPDLPQALEDVIVRAMQSSPEDRYQNAGELRAALEAFVSVAADREPARRVRSAERDAPRVPGVAPRRRTYALIALAGLAVWIVAMLASEEPAAKRAEPAKVAEVSAPPEAPSATTRLVLPSDADPVAAPLPRAAEQAATGAPVEPASASAPASQHAKPSARAAANERSAVPGQVPTEMAPGSGVEPGSQAAAATEPAPLHTGSQGSTVEGSGTPRDQGYRLSERGLKKVFP